MASYSLQQQNLLWIQRDYFAQKKKKKKKIHIYQEGTQFYLFIYIYIFFFSFFFVEAFFFTLLQCIDDE